MNKIIKLVHYLGITFFLGSIFTYILISTLVKDNSFNNLVFARQIISTGTMYLTIPGICLIIISDVLSRFSQGNFLKQKWLNIKHIITTIIVLNTFFLIIPAEREALEFAKISLSQGTLSPAYTRAYLQESIAGSLNVILAIIAVVIVIYNVREIAK